MWLTKDVSDYFRASFEAKNEATLFVVRKICKSLHFLAAQVDLKQNLHELGYLAKHIIDYI